MFSCLWHCRDSRTAWISFCFRTGADEEGDTNSAHWTCQGHQTPLPSPLAQQLAPVPAKQHVL